MVDLSIAMLNYQGVTQRKTMENHGKNGSSTEFKLHWDECLFLFLQFPWSFKLHVSSKSKCWNTVGMGNSAIPCIFRRLKERIDALMLLDPPCWKQTGTWLYLMDRYTCFWCFTTQDVDKKCIIIGNEESTCRFAPRMKERILEAPFFNVENA